MEATENHTLWITFGFATKTSEVVDNLPLMRNIYPSLYIVLLYLTLVVYGKSAISSWTTGYKLQAPLIFYNTIMVLVSSYITYEIIMAVASSPSFNLLCQPVDYSVETSASRLSKVMWWCYFSKILELADTMFFILRKKQNQITFLHVYHHSAIVLLWWIVVKYVPGGNGYFAALLNSIVHVVMYTYYGLSACGDTFTRHLWWKKYLTLMQLSQFILIEVHNLYGMYANCGYPRSVLAILSFFVLTQIILFLNFFIKSYSLKPAVNTGKFSKEN